MTSVFCVRAESGMYARHFVEGGYVAIGWNPIADLSSVRDKDELVQTYREAFPEDRSSVVVGQQVGQIARFLWDMKEGDYVITPAADTDLLHYGALATDASYFYDAGNDGCPQRHRRRVAWVKDQLRRSSLPVPLQSALRAQLTVFGISQRDEFFAAIGKAPPPAQYDPYRAVLEQVLHLDPKEFEILTMHVLAAIGFENTVVTGRSGDGGVDVRGELNAANLARVKLFVQVKRYRLGARVSASVVKQLRAVIPHEAQGAFITTADYQEAAHEVSREPGFPRIGLVNGRQLVDLLVEHWPDIPSDFRDRLGLRQGLVRSYS